MRAFEADLVRFSLLGGELHHQVPLGSLDMVLAGGFGDSQELRAYMFLFVEAGCLMTHPLGSWDSNHLLVLIIFGSTFVFASLVLLIFSWSCGKKSHSRSVMSWVLSRDRAKILHRGCRPTSA